MTHPRAPPFDAAAVRIAVVSDIHYASPAEQLRRGHESRVIPHPLLRLLVRAYRRFFWLADPLAHNHLFDDFLLRAAKAEHVVANGDYSCDTAFVGLADDAALASASTVVGRLRAAFAPRLDVNYGDHELGKMSLFGGAGGLRFRSWHRCAVELDLRPLWHRRIGSIVLIGVVSSLVALPVFAPETLADELPEWKRLRQGHLAELQTVLDSLTPRERIILFVHDPTALPFLWREPALRARVAQIEMTIIGHLHTPVIYWNSRWLAGLPPVRCLGTSIRRMSEALHDGRLWKPFHVRLVPSLTGCQLLKDGGFGWLEIDPDARRPAQLEIERLPWCPPSRSA